jgi:hypothetical protein
MPDNPKSRFENRLPLSITGVFFSLSFAGILRHKMWRDEYQAWLLARDSHSLPGLLRNMRYDGHPALWHVCLFFITAMTRNPFWMQLFHILISASFVYLFNRYSPFPLLEKILFTFGYYSFFEYNLISRSYGLGLLLTFIFCILYKNRRASFVPISAVLFLLANTHVFGLGLSLCFAGILCLDQCLMNVPRKLQGRPPRLQLAVGWIIVISGWVLSILQLYPKPGNTFQADYHSARFNLERAKLIFFRLVTAYAALPKLGDPHFWNTSFFETTTIANNSVVWPALILVVFFFYFLRKPLMLLLYATATTGFLGFFYYTLQGYPRYIGHLFLALIATIWLSSYYEDVILTNKYLMRLSTIGRRGGGYLFTLLLFIGFVGGIGSYWKDLTLPLSTSGEAADFLRKNKLEHLDMIGTTDFIISPLAAILDRVIYYPETGKEGSFITWDKSRKDRVSTDELKTYFLAEQKKGAKRIVMILCMTAPFNILAASVPPGYRLQLLQSIGAGVVENEQYFIYLVEKKKP